MVIPVVAFTGFCLIWLGFGRQVHHDSISLHEDLLAWSSAQAESPADGAMQAHAEPSPSPSPSVTENESISSGSIAADACIPGQALNDLKKRERAISEREAQLQSRESDLVAREKAIEERMQQLQAVRQEHVKQDAATKKAFEEKLARTVELLESMAPKAASQLIATSEDGLAVEAMSRMSTTKLSKIMNVMDPKRSVHLMALLSGTGSADKGTGVTDPSLDPKKKEKL
jgi:flagellar motility protein MotE (MotC chaperone)